MKVIIQDIWRAGLTMLKVFGLVFAGLVVLGLFFPAAAGFWQGLVVIGVTPGLAGFRRAWQRGPFVASVVGIVLATAVVLTALFALPDPIAQVTLVETLATFLYVLLCSAVLAALGFVVARLIRARQRQDPAH